MNNLQGRNMRGFIIGAVTFFLSTCLISTSFSQEDQGRLISASPRSSSTNYRFAEPNELTIIVNILGAIRQPGRYEISRSIDIMNLISLAGGPTENGDLGDVRILRAMKIADRIVRREISVNLEDLNEIYDPYLVLQQDDFVFIGRSSKITAAEILSYTTAITATVLTFLYIRDYAKR